jgi:hypothetical protein
LVFDSQIDVIKFGDLVLFKSLTGFERLFVPPSRRVRGAMKAVDELVSRVPVANLVELLAVAEKDSVFGARLRLLEKSRLLETISVERLKKGLVETGLERRFLVGNELVFPVEGPWRWRFLDALEDSFVSSTGTGILYRSGSKKPWNRRQVSGVRRTDGQVTDLCGGDWGPLPVQIVAGELLGAQGVYFVEIDGELVDLEPVGRTNVTASHGSVNLLDRLGACP